MSYGHDLAVGVDKHAVVTVFNDGVCDRVAVANSKQLSLAQLSAGHRLEGLGKRNKTIQSGLFGVLSTFESELADLGSDEVAEVGTTTDSLAEVVSDGADVCAT